MDWPSLTPVFSAFACLRIVSCVQKIVSYPVVIQNWSNRRMLPLEVGQMKRHNPRTKAGNEKREWPSQSYPKWQIPLLTMRNAYRVRPKIGPVVSIKNRGGVRSRSQEAHSNRLQIAQLMCLWVDIQSSLMFIVIWLRMNESCVKLPLAPRQNTLDILKPLF